MIFGRTKVNPGKTLLVVAGSEDLVYADLPIVHCHVSGHWWSYLTQAVDVGGADGGVAEASDVTDPEVVHNHQQDIGPLV